MTPNELAGQLQIESSNMEYGCVVSDWELLSDAADLIVKQADDIAELKNARDYWWLQYKDVFNKLEAQQK